MPRSERVQVHPNVQRAYELKHPKKQLPSLAWVGPSALALFAFSGQLKATPMLAWVPVDFTLLSAAIAGLAFLVARAKNGPGTRAIAIPIALWLLFLLGTYQATLDDYSVEKLVTLYTFTLFAAIAPFHLLRLPAQRESFVKTLAVVSVGAAAITLTGSPDSTDASVLILEGSTTIGAANIAGTGVLIFTIAAVTMRAQRARRLILAGFAVVLLSVLIMTGSRGPFLGIIVGIAAVLLFSGALKSRRSGGIFWSVILAGAGFWWATSRSIYGGDRAFAWLSGERDNSTTVRQYLWDITLEVIPWEPLGVGWGDFTEHLRLPATLKYPHNLILEVFYEGGWLVGLALVLFVAASILRLWRRSSAPTSAILFGLLIFALVNSMVSGDINAHRLLWVLLSCAWVIPAQEKQAPVTANPSEPQPRRRPGIRPAPARNRT